MKKGYSIFPEQQKQTVYWILVFLLNDDVHQYALNSEIAETQV